MAYTKIHAIKATVDKAIDYICNSEKTDEKMYISSYACSPETAAIDFKYTLDHCRENSPNKAYHLIQAFAPGEVDFEEAHTIGQELADKVLEGKYSYVVTTHIDKGHVHNHIIFCATDNLEYNKYHDCKQTYYRIRQLSDELCKEHQLSVIIPGENRGKKYKEWQADKNGTAWKPTLRKDINSCIQSSSTYEEFLLLLRARGYEIKGETFDDNAAKYISFRPLDKDRFIRGSIKSLGKEYTKERIKERIEMKRERKAVIPKKDYSSRSLIDTSDEKFQNSPGLKHWAAIENLKIAAQSYNEVGSLSDLEHQIAVKTEAGKSAKQSVVQLEHSMKDLAEIIKYAEQYKANRTYHTGYKKAKNPDAYFRKYESQIILYGGARRMLEQAGINLKGLNIEKLKAEYHRLETQKKELTATYKNCEKEVQDLKRKQENLNRYLGREVSQEHITELTEKDRNQIL
ncbi:relaxase/mobilization nuclease domain-containing protein [Acetivibrio ethanolgignens]|uniref:Rlx protein n=1 Tax=Acetivibrio ethanolgignens TaxID=290052 RepID=A0A0V8QBG1_9FIRM|nr:relaxase/mobilization nuclease domain-containing protein [Acetivibrio ethanolgignens]KSV57417.1 rlx protein [Acetivibrio ethanolgignens]